MLIGVVEEGDDLLLLARIERAGMDLAAASLDVLDQRRELVAVAPAGEYRKAFCSEFFGDLAADKVAGTNEGHGRVSLLHNVLRPRVASTVLRIARQP